MADGGQRTFRLTVVGIAVLLTLPVYACESRRESRLLHETDHEALVAACRRLMATMPPSGNDIDPLVYHLDGDDPRFRGMLTVLKARSVTPALDDPRVPAEIRRLEPIFLSVTPDAVGIHLCGAGISCGAYATRSGADQDAIKYIEMSGEHSCKALVPGLWYCHE
jgi:hypothetical protein